MNLNSKIKEIENFGDQIDWDFHVDQVLEEKNIIYNPSLDHPIVVGIKKYATGNKLLDCGCHVGRWSNFFMGAGFDYTGIDQSSKAIATAMRLNTNAKYINSFLWDYRTDEKYDIIVFIAVLQHNKHDEKEKILSNLSTLIKSNGVLFFTESTVDVQTTTQYTYNQWIDFAERHGFIFKESFHANSLGFDDHYLFVNELKN